MTRRNGNGVWEGNLKEGTGKVKVGERRFRRSLFFCFPLEKGEGDKPRGTPGSAARGADENHT